MGKSEIRLDGIRWRAVAPFARRSFLFGSAADSDPRQQSEFRFDEKVASASFSGPQFSNVPGSICLGHAK